MRKPSLTRQSKFINGHVVNTYEWRGHQIDVFDSVRNGMLVIELMGDDELQPNQKAQLLPAMLFPNPEDALRLTDGDFGDLLIHVVWEAFGLDISSDQRYAQQHEEAVFDYEQDAARIKASLLQCFGIDWDSASTTTSYVDMGALLGMLTESGEETPFQQAIKYRMAKPPKRDKYNKDYCDAFDARRKHFALDRHCDTASANDAAAGMFEAMKRAAVGGAQ